MIPALRLIEKRREPRYAARGLVILRVPGPRPVEIRGELMDVSESGFRASYRSAPFETGQVIEFEHQGRSGGARVMWNRIDGGSVQTGFLIL
jgi:hypothetical protein